MIMTMADSNCHIDGTNRDGGKGVTLWRTGVTENIHLAPEGKQDDGYYLTFTGTHPKGYQGGNACLLSWDLLIDSNSPEPDVQVDYYLNMEPHLGPKFGTSVHSRIRGHDITEIVDLVPHPTIPYHDDNHNTILFKNKSPVGVWINNLRIIRIYGMSSLRTSVCSAEVPRGSSGNVDSTRKDNPCNSESCGGYSFTKFGPDSTWNTIPPASSRGWMFKNPIPNPSNYVGPYSCFFNLNNLDINKNASDNDVRFGLSVNGSPPAIMYHSKLKDRNIAAAVDLTARHEFNGFFDDSPGAFNAVTLTNYDTDVSLRLLDGGTGKVDVYRVYRTTPLL